MAVRAKIVGTGSSLPSRVVTNKDLETMVDTSDEWIRTRTGICERRIAGEGENNSLFAAEAGRRALEMAGVDAADLDLILVATMTPDMVMPSVACLVQDALGAGRAGAMDLMATCSGFIYGLSVAERFVRCDPSMKVLVIGSEVLSRRVNWEDRSTCVLFGDGAGAALVTGEEGDRGILSSHLHSDGSLWELLTVKGCGTRFPVSHDNLEQGLQFIQMQGREVFKHAVKALESVALEALESNGLNMGDVDLLIAHQANMRILDFLRQRMGLEQDKVFINIDKYGNTSAASIAIALDEANRQGRLSPGMNVLMVAFGGGFTWGSMLVRW